MKNGTKVNKYSDMKKFWKALQAVSPTPAGLRLKKGEEVGFQVVGVTFITMVFASML